jgi:putative protease
MVKRKTKGSKVKAKKATGKKVAKKAPKKMKKPAKRKPAKKRMARAKPAKAKVAKKKVTMKRPAPAAAKKKPPAKPLVTEPMAPPAAYVPAPNETAVGKVTHYYSHLQVAVVQLDRGSLQVGDTIHIKGHTTDFHQVVESMEIEHQRIERAEAGNIFGLKVMDHAREHDVVYKVQT